MSAPAERNGPLLPFGPYDGQSVEAVAVIDPGYLADLVREGVGPAELRAEAARALVQRGRLPSAAPERGRPSVAWPIGLGGDHRAAVPGSRRAWVHLAAFAALGTLVALVLSVLIGPSGGSEPEARDAAPALNAASRTTTSGAAGLATPIGNGPALGTKSAGKLDDHQPFVGTPEGIAAGPGDDGVTDGSGRSRSATPPPCGSRTPGAIPGDAAGDFVGTFQAVEFRVAATKDTGRVTFLNSQVPYAGSFYVAIFPGDYGRFPAPPATHFAGRCIVVQGMIETYRGAPEIVLRGPEDVRELPD